MKKTIYILFVCLLITATASKAEVLAEYTFTGGSLASTDLSEGTTASAFVPQPSAAYAAADPSGTHLTDVIKLMNSDQLTPAYSVDGNQYHAFSIQPKTGNILTLTNIVFDVYADFPHKSGVAVGVSTNGFSGYNPDTGFVGEFPFDPTDYSSRLRVVNIDITGFTDLTTASTVDFRIYFKLDGGETIRSYSVDNIVVTGSIVPIGSSAIMIQ